MDGSGSHPPLGYRLLEFSRWYDGEWRRTGVCFWSDITPLLPKYHQAMEDQAAEMLKAAEAGNPAAFEKAFATIKTLYGRAVERIAGMRAQEAQQ